MPWLRDIVAHLKVKAEERRVRREEARAAEAAITARAKAAFAARARVAEERRWALIKGKKIAVNGYNDPFFYHVTLSHHQYWRMRVRRPTTWDY